jgi:hypothetical protein
MVSRRFTERCLDHARTPRTTFMPLAGMGHQLYLDHLAEAFPPTFDWIERALEGQPVPAEGAAG